MNIDERTIYIFVRNELPVEQQIVQANHAVFHMAGVYFRNFGCSAIGIPRVIVLQALSEKSLNKAIGKLRDAGIPNLQFIDPDNPQFGTSAVATEPLTQENSLPLANYKLWRYSPPSVASAEVALNGQRGASFVSTSQSARTMCTAEATGMWPFNAPAAPAEHLPLKQEVGGENPSGSSI